RPRHIGISVKPADQFAGSIEALDPRPKDIEDPGFGIDRDAAIGRAQKADARIGVEWRAIELDQLARVMTEAIASKGLVDTLLDAFIVLVDRVDQGCGIEPAKRRKLFERLRLEKQSA